MLLLLLVVVVVLCVANGWQLQLFMSFQWTSLVVQVWSNKQMPHAVLLPSSVGQINIHYRAHTSHAH